jgi:hypothetical protein
MPPSGTRSSLDRVADAALDLTLPRKGSGGLNPEVLARARAVNLELKGDHIVKPFVVAGEGPQHQESTRTGRVVRSSTFCR